LPAGGCAYDESETSRTIVEKMSLFMMKCFIDSKDNHPSIELSIVLKRIYPFIGNFGIILEEP
jgi:hypothetical protein